MISIIYRCESCEQDGPSRCQEHWAQHENITLVFWYLWCAALVTFSVILTMRSFHELNA